MGVVRERQMLLLSAREFKNAASTIEQGFGSTFSSTAENLAKKIVSHFNIGIALELTLKLHLYIAGKTVPKHHKLKELYGQLPDQIQDDMENTFYECVDGSRLQYVMLAAFNVFITAKKPPLSRPNSLASLEDYLEYFDADFMLSKKRYTWEETGKDESIHYIINMSIFVEFIDRMLEPIDPF